MTATATKTVRAVLYVRISKDSEGKGLGVARQEKACREYAEARDWTVTQVYVDNDKSATRVNKPRPEWLAMLGDVEAGRIDAIVCWDQDRLVRQPAELESFINLVERHGVSLGNVNVAAMDLATPQGRLFARQLGAFAAFEGEHKSQRMRAKWQQDAEAGKPWMGGPRPYGYLPDRVTLDPREAPFIADAAARVLAGETLRSIVADMNERGARTVTGKPWSAPLLRQVLRSARISGRRETGTREGKSGVGTIVATGCWEAIITPEDSDRLRVMFAEPGRTVHGRSTRAKYLLSGTLRCGRCDSPMTALAWEKGGKYLYRCPSPGQLNRDSCGRLSVLMKHAEPVVRNLVLELVARGDFRDRLNERAKVAPGMVDSIRKDEASLEALAEMMAAGDLTMAEWKTARELIQARLAANRATMARQVNAAALDLLDPDDDLVDQWDNKLNPAQRRAIVAEVLDHVTVKPVTKIGERFDPTRLVPEWRL